jgi:hypothetical protein
MSHENVDFLRQGYEALHRGDLETFMALSRERLDVVPGRVGQA